MLSRMLCGIISLCSLTAFVLSITFQVHGAFAVFFCLLFFFFLACTTSRLSKTATWMRYMFGIMLILFGLLNISRPETNRVFGVTIILSGLLLILDFLTSWVVKKS